MRKTKRQISYVDHRQEEPVARTKQFYKKSEFDRAIRDLTGIPRTHASVEEHVRINIYPEQAGRLFDKGLLG
jgi:hypothetical protein